MVFFSRTKLLIENASGDTLAAVWFLTSVLAPHTHLSQYSVTGTRRCVRVMCAVVTGDSTAAAKSARVAVEASAGGAGGHTSKFCES